MTSSRVVLRKALLTSSAILAIVFLLSWTSTAKASISFPDILTSAQNLESWVIDARRSLHEIPELMYQEFNTSIFIRDWLDSKHIKYKYPYARTGLVATIGSGEPIVALRADMDALPVEEPHGLPFRSKNPGVMHACGHDAHVAMLLGAAAVLKEHEGKLKGSVKLVFQPAEEGGAGGDLMLKEGALEGASAAFAMHVMPHVPSGVVGTRGGAIMAGSNSFLITLQGRGGHAAIPHLNVDPIVAAAALVGALQTLVSRETSPLGSAVLSVSKFNAGEGAFNVIPDNATFGGTIRGHSDVQMAALRMRVQEMSSSLAAAYGCTAVVDWRLDEQKYYPPTVNDPEMAKFALDVAGRLFGSEQAKEMEGLMAGEDFAFFTQVVPSAYLFFGIRNESLGSVHGLHTAKFLVDESVLHKGAALHAALAVEYLQQHQLPADKQEL